MTTILFPAGTTKVRYDHLAHHIAKALHDDPMMYGAARVNLDDELAQAVRLGALKLRDPLTLGLHPMPIGAMRESALVLLDDLRDYLKGRGISVDVEQSPPELPTAPAAQVEPVQSALAPIRWTDEALSELASYRKLHGTKKAADHFGISGARVRSLLPREKRPAATPFSGLGSRHR